MMGKADRTRNGLAKLPRHLMAAIVLVALILPGLEDRARAEVYIAGQVGGAFPQDLRNVEGTGTIQGVVFNDLNLANTLMYGGKLGYFFEDPGLQWLGAEIEVFAGNPHVKSQVITAPGGGPTAAALGNGSHLRTLTSALNVIARYPGARWQPYVGLGLAYVNAKLSDEGFTVSDSAPGVNLLAGVKVFVTRDLSVFAEGKYTYSSFQFEDAGVVGAGIKGVYSVPGVMVGIAWHFH